MELILLGLWTDTKYLGLHFTTKLSLTRITGELVSKAKVRLAQILKCRRRLGNVQINVFFKLFDAQVLACFDVRLRSVGDPTVRGHRKGTHVRM